MHEDARVAALKMGTATGGALLAGLTLNELVALATLVYVVLQIGLLVPKYCRMFAAWRRGGRNVE